MLWFKVTTTSVYGRQCKIINKAQVTNSVSKPSGDAVSIATESQMCKRSWGVPQNRHKGKLSLKEVGVGRRRKDDTWVPQAAVT